MFKRIIDWFNSAEETDEYPLIHDGNRTFVESLDNRQMAYYFSLHDSWRKELTRLETRVFKLEQEK